MPNLRYQTFTPNNIGWWWPGLAVGPAFTFCGGGADGGLMGLGNPQALTLVNLYHAAQNAGVYMGTAWRNQRERAWRRDIVASMNLVDGANYFAVTPNYTNLDPDEKAFISEHMGAVLCTAASLILGPFINHMRLVRWINAGGVVVYLTGQRPDFVSQDALLAGRQVWEAKGRSGGGYSATLRGALDQTYSPTTLNGAAPTARFAALTRPQGVNHRWELDLVDPGEPSGGSLPPEVQDAVFKEYYRPYLEALTAKGAALQSVEAGGLSFQVVADGDGASIGVATEIFTALQATYPEPGGLTKAIQPLLASPLTEKIPDTLSVDRNLTMLLIPSR